MVADYLILGAGVTGLSAGVELQDAAIVVLMMVIGMIMFYTCYILKTPKSRQALRQ